VNGPQENHETDDVADDPAGPKWTSAWRGREAVTGRASDFRMVEFTLADG